MRAGLTGWVDYDRSTLVSLPLDERIEWFNYRVRLVVINPLKKILETQILGSQDSSALLIAGVSLLSAIDATGMFITGIKDSAGKKVQNNVRFKRFIAEYMSDELRNGTMGPTPLPTVLWEHFRNGLTHGFAVRHGGFEGNPGQPYFDIKGSSTQPYLSVNPSRLYEDFVGGFGRYISDLRTVAHPRRVTFEGVFEAVFIRGE